jgi:hypothetical protein
MIDPHRPFAGVPFLAVAGGYRTCSQIFLSMPILANWCRDDRPPSSFRRSPVPRRRGGGIGPAAKFFSRCRSSLTGAEMIDPHRPPAGVPVLAGRGGVGVRTEIFQPIITVNSIPPSSFCRSPVPRRPGGIHRHWPTSRRWPGLQHFRGSMTCRDASPKEELARKSHKQTCEHVFPFIWRRMDRQTGSSLVPKLGSNGPCR